MKKDKDDDDDDVIYDLCDFIFMIYLCVYS